MCRCYEVINGENVTPHCFYGCNPKAKFSHPPPKLARRLVNGESHETDDLTRTAEDSVPQVGP